jgi:tetratricopeptide (TPR) repeat protein
MASSREMRRRLEQQAAKGAEDQSAQDQKQALDAVQDLGQDMGAEQAASLQSTVGNADLSALLKDAGRTESVATAHEEEQEEEQEQDFGEELEGTGLEESLGDFLAGAGARESLVSGAGVEELSVLFGGDPEDEPPPRPPKVRFNRRLAPMGPGMRRDEDEEAPWQGELDASDLPPLERPGAPQGDERLDALWAWLQDPSASALPDLSPEALVDVPGALERCQTLGRFLAGACRDPLARALARMARPLFSSDSLADHVALAALMAEQAALVEARSAGLPATNRACALALEDDAPAVARRAARICMEQRKLQALLVSDVAMHNEPDTPLRDLTECSQRGRRLIEAALRFACPGAPIPDPGTHAAPSPDDGSADASTAEVDALLAELLGDDAGPERLSDRHLEPWIRASDGLLLQAGRAQVELGAAAIAVRRVTGARPRVAVLLKRADKELRQTARQVTRAQNRAEALLGKPYDQAVAPLQRQEQALIDLADRARSLRDAVTESLAWAAVGMRPSTPPVPAQGRSDLDPDWLLDQATRLHRARHPAAPALLAHAAARARAAHRYDLDLRARLRLVHALADQGDLADALALLERAERESLATEALQVQRALARLAVGRVAALADLEQTLAHIQDPHDGADAHERLAEAFGDLGVHASAVQHLQRAADLDPERAHRIHLTLAGLHLRLGHRDRAAACCRRSAHSPDPRIRLAALALLGRLSPAPWTLGPMLASASALRSWSGIAAAAHAAERSGHPELIPAALAHTRRHGDPGALLIARQMERGQRASAAMV